MGRLSGQKGGTLESGLIQNQKSSSIAESVVVNKAHPCRPSNNDLPSGTQKAGSSLTLALDSISKDEALKPYWNKCCEENQLHWWLPHQIGSPESASSSSEKSSNYLEVESSFWKKKWEPTNLTLKPLSLSLLPSATATTGSVVIKGTRKIRLYPKDQSQVQELLRQQRRAYNQAIACFKEQSERPELRTDKDYSKTELRRTIRDFVRSEVSERGGDFLSSGTDEMILKAFLTRDAIIRERTKGKPAEFSFKSRKSPSQSFMVQKLTPKFITDRFRISEPLPEDSIGKVTTFVFENGRWFVCAQKHIVTAATTETQGVNAVAIDPGIRTFVTAYSGSCVTKYGDRFFEQRIFPLLYQLDQLISQRDRSKHPEWKRGFEKKIHRLRWRIKDRIDDLHRRVALELVTKFDVIFLPTFETQQMGRKAKRKIRRKSVRAMFGLAHYRFKMVLKWMAKKHGKFVVDANEAYTSKTRSWDGFIDNHLGGKEVIHDDRIEVDRDVNGARGIMLRALYGTCPVIRRQLQN